MVKGQEWVSLPARTLRTEEYSHAGYSRAYHLTPERDSPLQGGSCKMLFAAIDSTCSNDRPQIVQRVVQASDSSSILRGCHFDQINRRCCCC